jgi:hypothetical protein
VCAREREGGTESEIVALGFSMYDFGFRRAGGRVHISFTKKRVAI